MPSLVLCWLNQKSIWHFIEKPLAGNHEKSIAKTSATRHGSDMSTKIQWPLQHFEKKALQSKGKKRRKRAGPQPQHDSIGNRPKSHDVFYWKDNPRQWSQVSPKKHVFYNVSPMSKDKTIIKQNLLDDQTDLSRARAFSGRRSNRNQALPMSLKH